MCYNSDMKIKKLLLSLILIVSTFSLIACKNNGDPTERNPHEWFVSEELTAVGLSALPSTQLSALTTSAPLEANNFLTATAKIASQKAFEQYVISIGEYFSTHYPNTSGYNTKKVSSATANNLNCYRIEHNENLIYYGDESKSYVRAFWFYYTTGELSTETTHILLENTTPTKVKIWNPETTYCLKLHYYTSDYGEFKAGTFTFKLENPTNEKDRYFSVFDGAITQ